MPGAADLVLVLSAANIGFLHVGEAAKLSKHLTDNDVQLVNGKQLEIFNADGVPLGIEVAGEQREITEPDEEAIVQIEVDTQLLLDRIALALAKIQVDVHEKARNDDKLKGYRVPFVRASLPATLAALAVEFGVPEGENEAGKLHRASPHPHG